MSLDHKKIAKRYVNSLFTSLTKKTESAGVAKDMNDLGAMINASPEFQSFIKSPLLAKSAQKSGVEALAKKAKLSKPVANLLSVLVENRRLNVLPAIITITHEYMAAESGIIPVTVSTARQLTATDQKKISTQLKTLTGKDIEMHAYVDETLIGGVVIQVESTLIDGSIKTKLDKLERELTKKVA